MTQYKQRNTIVSKLEKGIVYEGKLLAIQESTNNNIIVLKSDQGGVDKFFSCSAIDHNLFADDIGKKISLCYTGDKDIGSGKTFKEVQIGVEEDGFITKEDSQKESNPNTQPF